MGLIAWPETSMAITNTRCVTAQESAVLIYFAVEAWNHAYLARFFLEWEIVQTKFVENMKIKIFYIQ